MDQKKEVAQYRQVVQLIGDDAPFVPGEPLSLARAMLLANAANERLAIEGESFVQAIIDKRRAVAGFLPTVNLVPSYSFQDRSGLPPGASADQTTLTAAGSINLFNGFRDVESLRRATATIEQRRQLLLDAQQTLLLDVARVYYQILRSERSVTVLRDSLSVQEERVRQQTLQAQIGMKISLDVAQSRAQEAATRVQLTNAVNDVQTGRTTLAFVTAAPVEASGLSDDFALPRDLPDLPAYQFDARHRPDVLAAERASESARHAVQIAVGRYYPTLALNLNALLYTHPDGGPDWNGLLQANLPIFSAGLIEADVRATWSQFRSAEAGLSLARRQADHDVSVAYQDLSSSRQRLGQLQTQLSASEEAFRQAEGQYNAGTTTNLDRITALNTLLNAQLQLASEQYDQKLLYLNLLRSAGSLQADGQVAPATTRPGATTDPAAATSPAATRTPRLVPTTVSTPRP